MPTSPERTAVLVIDLQNDFCSDRGALAVRGADVRRNQEILSGVASFVDEARAQGCLIVWVRQVADAYTASPARQARSAAMGRTATTVCARDTWGAELAAPLAPHSNDVVMEKHRYSAFVGTALEMVLRSTGRDHVVVCGTAANVCVDSTARDAYMRDFHVRVPDDLVGYSREDLGRPALETLSIYFAEVTSAQSIIDAWVASTPTPAA